ncbi:MAG: TIGR04283 family arsenosugar biosynthesis glycosyltransferase [Deltaproteobacteria bacterium]|nr:TIGR04283 family arsenosugar biosynthesis glycosyltransferase [Deltaproteobacteria bacterium]
MSGEISIVVPTHNEAAAIAATLARLREPEILEVIVVDGGSDDGTPDLARPLADRVLETSAGRARQMNAGARTARGSILFFLHADTRVPEGFGADIVAACARAIGGRFDVELDAPGVVFRLIESAINLRSRWSRLATGDQGLFLRREVFEALGGYPEIALLEDLALCAKMKRRGRLAALRSRVRTSARRWQRHGTLRTVLLMWWIRSLYALGASPGRLARLYRPAR